MLIYILHMYAILFTIYIYHPILANDLMFIISLLSAVFGIFVVPCIIYIYIYIFLLACKASATVVAE